MIRFWNWTHLKNDMYQCYGKDSGKMLVHAGVVGWITSALAQIAAVVFNDKIPSDQKKFLVPQEIADAAFNIASFYIITNSAKDIGKMLVSTGKWSNQAIRNFVKENAKKININDIKMGDTSTNLEKTFKDRGEISEEFYKIYSPFKNGVDMITTAVGSVISCNIVTPILRNKFASKHQKDAIAREKTNLAPIDRPALPAQNRIGMEKYVANNIYPSSASLKI